jgi:hypothetical protein
MFYDHFPARTWSKSTITLIYLSQATGNWTEYWPVGSKKWINQKNYGILFNNN